MQSAKQRTLIQENPEPSLALSERAASQTRFAACYKINRLQQSILLAHPCAGGRSEFFRPSFTSTLSDYPSTGAGGEERHQANGLLGFVTTPP